MKRILIFCDGRPFGTNYIHWLIEDCKNNFWILCSDGSVCYRSKQRYSWKEVK